MDESKEKKKQASSKTTFFANEVAQYISITRVSYDIVFIKTDTAL